jgi:hypothetical protein
MIEVQELRAAERYIAILTLSGSFGAASVTVRDICEQGVQIEHPQPLRIGTRGRLWFKRGDVGAAVQAVVVWSHLSKTPSDEGKLLYHSGVKVESGTNEFASALQKLALQGAIRRDFESLDRKRQRILDRETEKSGKPIVKMIRPENDVPPDQSLLVRHTRERLRANPEEMHKWADRAKVSLAANGAELDAEELADREDVLAVWQYLERSIDLATIVRVFIKG